MCRSVPLEARIIDTLWDQISTLYPVYEDDHSAGMSPPPRLNDRIVRHHCQPTHPGGMDSLSLDRSAQSEPWMAGPIGAAYGLSRLGRQWLLE